MVERNIYAILIPIIFVVLICVVVLFEFIVKDRHINLEPNMITIVSSIAVLTGIACIAICIFLFGINQERIIRNTFVNCLTLFESDQTSIDKIKGLRFDIKKPGVWEKEDITYAGTNFVLSIENRLGPSKIGYRSYFLIYCKNHFENPKLENNNYNSKALKNDFAVQIDLKGSDYFIDNNILFVRLPINKKIEYQHLINAFDFLMKRS